MSKTYESSGIVFGNCWGGGKCGYRAEPLFAQTRLELMQQAENALKDGSLDSGMGFESLTGAVLIITETETIIHDDKQYKHSDTVVETIGDVSEDEFDIAMHSI